MAALPTRWLLSLLWLNLTNCFILERSPVPPSPPDCYIPCDESYCFGDVYCSWDPRQKSQIPTNYSLHWRTTHNNEKGGGQITTTKFNGLILRHQFSDPAKLYVWVQAKNQHGSANSSMVVFNTTDIIKPPPPKFSDLSDDEAFEIHWDSFCDGLMKFMGFCDVRYRTDTDQTWIEKQGFYSTFTIENPENCTAYELQVRCACGTSLASNWSATHRIPGLEMAPIGKLDVWMDCGILTKASDFTDCVLTWRKLPISQTCGVILGYEIKLTQSNNTPALVYLSTSLPMNQLKCEEMQCYFGSSIKDAISVSVSACNVHGTTKPSYLPKLVTGKWKTQVNVLSLNMSLKNMTVSWKVAPQVSYSLKEYVVQYKQAGAPLGLAFTWVTLNKSQTTACFEGQFQEYTPYQVSLFTVSHENEVRHLSSVIGYSLQKAPAKITLFKVKSIATTDVTLLWEPLPLSKQEGLVSCYQIGVVQNKEVYNMSAPPLDQNKMEMVLQHLNPGQEYEVWIRAMTAAGPGEKATLRFKTKHQEYIDYRLIGIPGCILIFLLICVLIRKNKMCPLKSTCYCEKIPDAQNCHVFREMKHQLHDPVTWISSPSNEPLQKVIVLEVVFIQSSLLKNSDIDEPSTTVGEWGSPTECHEDQRKYAEDHQRTEAYSKMVDSDEERSWGLSDEGACISGYEKHFMPTAAEVLEDF